MQALHQRFHIQTAKADRKPPTEEQPGVTALWYGMVKHPANDSIIYKDISQGPELRKISNNLQEQGS